MKSPQLVTDSKYTLYGHIRKKRKTQLGIDSNRLDNISLPQIDKISKVP